MHEKHPELLNDVRGLSEETTTGVHRLYEMRKAGTAQGARRSTSTTRSPSRSSTTSTAAASRLVDGIKRATDVMMAGKVAVVAGYGDVGKGSAASLRSQGARVLVTEIDPICALQAAMEGYEVMTHGRRRRRRRHLRHRHRQRRRHHPRAHAPDEGQAPSSATSATSTARSRSTALRNYSSGKKVKPQVDQFIFPDGKRLIVLAKGRLVNLGCATGHPSFVMSARFTNQVLAQIELWTEPARQVRAQGLRAAEAARREGRPPPPRASSAPS